MKKVFILAIFIAISFAVSAHAGKTQGVTDNTVIIGQHTDLSGPLASWGVAFSNGAKLRFKEANDAGGVHGREIKYITKDTRFQVPLAVKAGNKLINKDKIFLMLGGVGTAQNSAVFPIQFKANVPNFFPVTASEAMTIPFHKLKFGYYANYAKQVQAGVKYFVENKGIKSLCFQAPASEYGQELKAIIDNIVKKLDLEVKYTGSHKWTETEFTAIAAKINSCGCDMLVSGTTVKDTILLYSTLKKLGWGDKPVVTTFVPYMPLVAQAADGAMNGLYSVVPILIPDFKNGNDAAISFGKKYNDTYNTVPTLQAVSGYIFSDLTIKALEKAGRDLTSDSIVKALESFDSYVDPFGTSSVSFSSTNHTGGNRVSLTQVQDKKWVTIKESIPYDM